MHRNGRMVTIKTKEKGKGTWGRGCYRRRRMPIGVLLLLFEVVVIVGLLSSCDVVVLVLARLGGDYGTQMIGRRRRRNWSCAAFASCRDRRSFLRPYRRRHTSIGKKTKQQQNQPIHFRGGNNPRRASNGENINNNESSQSPLPLPQPPSSSTATTAAKIIAVQGLLSRGEFERRDRVDATLCALREQIPTLLSVPLNNEMASKAYTPNTRLVITPMKSAAN
jgi:hypothetical protein